MKRLLIFLALVALVAMPVQATAIICSPPGGTYAEPMFISCAMDSTSWGVDTGNQSMRFYLMQGGKSGIVRADISNEVSYLPYEGGYVARVFWPPPYNYSNSNTIVMTYGTALYPNTCPQALNTTLNETAGCRFAGYYSNESYIFTTWKPPEVIANFTGSPTAGTLPLHVTFTDTSENETGGCTYNWSITPATNVTGATGTLENHAALFADVGLYTVSHGVTCAGGSDIETKTDYINVTNQTAYVTTAFRATDGVTGNRITGATIHLNDVENSSWSNSSTTLGVATITVLQGHHISAYATALGFSDGEYLNAPAMAWTYDIMMLPTGFANVSTGNVTAYITVTDADTLQKLYGAQVNAMYSDGQGSHILESQTNSAGVASFVLPNNTNVHFTGVKSGYESSQIVINTGTGSGGDAHVEGELKMAKLSVTPTITPTTLPGGGTPAPTLTYLKYCNPSAADYNEDACRTSENTGMMDQLREAGPSIIGLCIVAILMGLLKIIMG